LGFGGFVKMGAILLPFRELIDLLRLVRLRGLTLLLNVELFAFSLDKDSASAHTYR
jgi:hypothetical protein